MRNDGLRDSVCERRVLLAQQREVSRASSICGSCVRAPALIAAVSVSPQLAKQQHAACSMCRDGVLRLVEL